MEKVERSAAEKAEHGGFVYLLLQFLLLQCLQQTNRKPTHQPLGSTNLTVIEDQSQEVDEIFALFQLHHGDGR